jgi:phosphatidate cytidylyltransferase
MTELGKRVSVAAVGIPTVLGLLYLGGWFLAVPLSAFAALGSVELYRLAEAVEVRPFRALGAAVSAGLVLIAARAESFEAFAPWGLGVLGMATATSLVAVIFVRGPDMRPLAVVAVTLLGAVYVGLSIAVVPLLHALPARSGWVAAGGSAWGGLAVLALPLAATWVGDASAYFAGSAWGDRKLAPSISPNKSWVGFWAGLAGAAAAAALWHVAARPVLTSFPLGVVGTVALGAALGLGAIVGDLAESLLKREANVKDSGTFFPGHGGALDRLDALLVTLPVAYVTLAIAEALP